MLLKLSGDMFFVKKFNHRYKFKVQACAELTYLCSPQSSKVSEPHTATYYTHRQSVAIGPTNSDRIWKYVQEILPLDNLAHTLVMDLHIFLISLFARIELIVIKLLEMIHSRSLNCFLYFKSRGLEFVRCLCSLIWASTRFLSPADILLESLA